MKKTFVKISLLSMMLSLMPTAMTSCKDYDDDITEINGTTDQLGSQIAALNTAIDANKTAAQNAQNAAEAALKAAQDAQAAGDQAEADAQAAMAVAHAAEAAAAQAKADALAEIKAQAEALSNKIGDNTDAISALLGRIAAVENDLANLDIEGINSKLADVNKAIEAVNIQLKALEGYETRLSQLESQYSALSGEVSTIKTNIAGVKENLTALETRVKNNELTIKDIQDDLAKVSQTISTQVQNGINTIAGIISSRLTSVTLMPNLYVGGIPTIEFKSAQYNSLVWQNNTWKESNKSYRVSNNKTEIEYRLNPATIQDADIDINGLAFVSRVATSRAAEIDNDIISVVSGKVSANGVLKITAGKSNTNSLNLSGNKINTVTLKVPIAKQHLFEGESSAHVYSEYTRLTETYFTPKLHKTNKVAGSIANHFNDSTEVYASSMDQLVAAEVVYDGALDLTTLVQGCGFVSPSTHTLMSLAEMKEYGFEVSFSLATRAYTTGSVDHANQQEFAKIEGSTLTPGSPTASGFSAGNKTSIGKQPIVHVWLKDVNNKTLVDQRYFKVKITPEEIKPIEFTITPNKTANMGCADYTWHVTWDEMTKQVLSQFPENGISKADFFARYGAHATSIEVKVDNVINNSLAANVSDNVTLDNTGASIPVMSFTLTNSELGILAQNKSKTYTVTLTYTDPNNLYSPVSITFTCVVTNNIANPTLGNTDNTKWVNGTMLLYPIPYGSPNAQTNAEYDTNIIEGRTNPLVKGLLNCATWNMALAETYGGVSMTFPANYGGWMLPAAANTLKQVNVAIPHDSRGINLVENETKMTVKWNARLNGIAGNEVTFGTCALQIVKPLQNPQLDNSVVLQDKPFQQTVSLGDKFTLKDAYGETVANTSGMAKNLWDYYGVTDIIFANAAGQIMITDDMNGTNPRTLASINMTADINVATKELTFHANGAPLQSDCYLQIPVQVKHYWGTLTANLYIRIQHTL